MSKFSVDLTNLPFPGIVDKLSFEDIYSQMRAQMEGTQPMLFVGNEAVILDAERVETDTEKYCKVPFVDGLKFLNVEADPAARQLQVVAYRELMIRQRVNSAAKGLTLAYAKDSDLDQLGANFDVARFDGELDASFRRRIQLSTEGYSTAGPEGAYISHALNAHPNITDVAVNSPTFISPTISQSVRDQLPDNALVLVSEDAVQLDNPMPGDVVVSIVSETGEANQEEIDAVVLALAEVKPITDRVIVKSAELINVLINATIHTFSNLGKGIVLQTAADKLKAYMKEQTRIGNDVPISGIMAALHQPGVSRVEMVTPTTDILCDINQAPKFTGVILNGVAFGVTP